MNTIMHNPYTGLHAAGFRFCFHVRAIAHRPLFLPLIMKKHRLIKRLLDGESPISVFNCHSIHDARHAFCELRKKFDFAYWAIKEYYIRDIKDADNIIPLRLNNFQHYVIDILQKRYHNRQPSRYIITKTFGRVGLTTCIQAYILWLQTCQCANNSYTCSSNNINLNPLKTDICRHLNRDVVPSEPWVYLPKSDRRAFFNTYKSPDFIRGINLGYAHYADMSKWKDSDGLLTSRTLAAASSAVLLKYFTLIVLEGNIPKDGKLRFSDHQKSYSDSNGRIKELQQYSNNPTFLDYVINANRLGEYSIFILINLDDTFSSDKKIRVPLQSSSNI